MAKKPPPLIDDQDAKLLEKVFSDVEPLPGRKIGKGAKKPRSLLKRNEKPPAPRHGNSNPVPNSDHLPEHEHGAAPGLDKRTAQRMRRGRMRIEARLDLHGMTQDAAHGALGRFLADAQAAGKRGIIVITGKGSRAEGPTGVLQGAVPRWLNEPGMRGRILSFSHAQPKDGGTGALYVMLRRLK